MSAYSRYAVRVEIGTIMFARDSVDGLAEFLDQLPAQDGVPVSGDALATLTRGNRTAQHKRRRLVNAYERETRT